MRAPLKKLKIILHSNYTYFILIFIVLLISLIRITLPRKSNRINDQKFTGTLVKYNINNMNLSMTLKNKEKILANYYFKTDEDLRKFKKNIRLGDRIEVIGNFSLPKENTTKNTFNYRKYLHTKNIFYIIKVDKYKKISSSNNIYFKIKQNLSQNLEKNCYLQTLILGNKDMIPERVMASYQENGISHILAISGMHISILSYLILKAMKKIFSSSKISYLLTIILLLCYISFTNISPSIIRGSLFFIILSFNSLYNLELSHIKTFLLVLVITILINPLFIFDIGFLYSFAISLALIITTTKKKNYLKNLLTTSAIAFYISIPISLYYFYQINLLSIIYNLFYIPLISIIIYPLSLIVLLCPYLLPLYNFFTNILENTSIFLNRITLGKLIFIKLPFYIYLLEFLLILYSISCKNKTLYRKSYLFSLLIILLHYFYPLYHQENYLKMIDVGQGESLLIHSKNESILIDTGGVATAKKQNIVTKTTIPLLKSLGIKKLKYLILTHNDFDHMGEAKSLLTNFKVEEVIINQGPINKLESSLIEEDYLIRKIKQDEHLTCGNIDLIQLNKNMSNENDSSQIYYVKYQNLSALLMGDASIKSEKELLKIYDFHHINILKIGHHGSKSSTSNELLEKTKPNLALISVGKDNIYKHPHQEVLEKLKNHQITYYLTSKSGTITINLDSKIITEDKTN